MKIYETDAVTIDSEIKKGRIALLPIGATEIHGPHLPCGTDTIIAERLCDKLAEKIEAVILPPIHYSQVWSLADFVGCIGISSELLTKMICELLLETKRNGFEYIVIVNTHVGNQNIIKEATRTAYKLNSDMKVLYFSYPGATKKITEVMEKSNFHGGFFHADEIETSYMLYLAPEYVDMQKALNENPIVPPLIDVTPTRWSEFTDNAVLGNATAATVDKGKAVLDHVVNEMFRLIKIAMNGEKQ